MTVFLKEIELSNFNITVSCRRCNSENITLSDTEMGMIKLECEDCGLYEHLE